MGSSQRFHSLGLTSFTTGLAGAACQLTLSRSSHLHIDGGALSCVKVRQRNSGGVAINSCAGWIACSVLAGGLVGVDQQDGLCRALCKTLDEKATVDVRRESCGQQDTQFSAGCLTSAALQEASPAQHAGEKWGAALAGKLLSWEVVPPAEGQSRPSTFVCTGPAAQQRCRMRLIASTASISS